MAVVIGDSRSRSHRWPIVKRVRCDHRKVLGENFLVGDAWRRVRNAGIGANQCFRDHTAGDQFVAWAIGIWTAERDQSWHRRRVPELDFFSRKAGLIRQRYDAGHTGVRSNHPLIKSQTKSFGLIL